MRRTNGKCIILHIPTLGSISIRQSQRSLVFSVTFITSQSIVFSNDIYFCIASEGFILIWMSKSLPPLLLVRADLFLLVQAVAAAFVVL